MGPKLAIGYSITVLILAWCTWWAVIPQNGSRRLAFVSFIFGFVINELPFPAIIWLLASTILAFLQGDINSIISWIIFGLAILTASGLAIIFFRGLKSIQIVFLAIEDIFKTSGVNKIDRKAGNYPRFHLIALLGPFFRRNWKVRHIPNISYGDVGKRNLLDIYHHHSRPVNAPVLIHLHGGAMTRGKKNREGLPLLYRLAAKGWLCISANYQLMPVAKFPLQLIDVKKVIAWVRNHGHEYGSDNQKFLLPVVQQVGRLLSRWHLRQMNQSISLV